MACGIYILHVHILSADHGAEARSNFLHLCQTMIKFELQVD